MRLQELKERVIAEFGDELERATPESVERFVASVHAELSEQMRSGEFIVVDESSSSYVDVLRQFFRKTLDMLPEDAAVLLWLTAFEWLFSTIEE
ncbi:MAG: hypothetical protein RMK18_07470 [Armatimonadota bacterium]|nr:hypothetical protein [Armatimonadota bacterium]MCX7778201.1 hypothetical protein [Armatimonadota bacterium]MDW8025685.1 hypothetical protein [Armatimonadota bacterium]